MFWYMYFYKNTLYAYTYYNNIMKMKDYSFTSSDKQFKYNISRTFHC